MGEHGQHHGEGEISGHLQLHKEQGRTVILGKNSCLRFFQNMVIAENKHRTGRLICLLQSTEINLSSSCFGPITLLQQHAETKHLSRER